MPSVANTNAKVSSQPPRFVTSSIAKNIAIDLIYWRFLEALLMNPAIQVAIGAFNRFDPAIDYHLIHQEAQAVLRPGPVLLPTKSPKGASGVKPKLVEFHNSFGPSS
jgi:hypothetical protein